MSSRAVKRSREQSATIHESQGIRVWAGRKWEKLVKRFGQDVSGTRRFKILSPQTAELEDMYISNEFAEYIQGKFNRVSQDDLVARDKWSNGITKQEITPDDDLVEPEANPEGRTGSDGPRLDGAANRRPSGVGKPVRITKLVRDVRCLS